MSENRDEATGQFSASEEPAFGLAGVERDAGYVPYKEETAAADTDELTVEQAVEQHISSTAEADIKTYSAVSDLLDENVSLTVEQAAQIKTDMDAADEKQSELKEADKLRKEIDELRGADAEARPVKAEAPLTPEAEVEKFLEIPHVKEAVEKLTGEAETARREYQNGLTAATAIAQATFFSQFPEFAGIPENQQKQALAIIQQHDPARAAQIQAAADNFSRLAEQHQAEQARIDQDKLSKTRSYVKSEGERFEGMIKSVPKAERDAIVDGIVAKIQEYGGDKNQFFKLMQSSEFANATVQRLLWDVGKLHRIENAPRAVASKTLPPVQRPGVSQNRSGNSADIQALDRRLSQSGSIQDAVALYTARSRARG